VTSIEILKLYGTVRFQEEISGVKCEWINGDWLRHEYGNTKEDAADQVLGSLHYLIYRHVRQIESGW